MASTPRNRTLPARLRRERVLELVEAQEFMRVADLAEMFEVSSVTMRTDLEHLAGRGLLRRVRGGAVPRSPSRREPAFEESEATRVGPKRAIGEHVASLIGPGETVILDVGSTTTAIAQAIARRTELQDVVVFTNGLTIALALEAAAPRLTVVLTGGTLRPRQHSLVDPLASLILDQITAKWAFIGCNGIDVEAGVTNVNLPESDIKRRMIRAANRRVVCADSSKLGAVALARVCDLDEVDLLVTDDAADPSVVSELRAAGVDVTLVGASKANDS